VGRDIDYRTFVRNRLLRVGPLYLLVLMLALVVAGGSFSLWGAIQTTLGFGRFPGGFVAGAFAVVLWTVGVEVQFYLLFPFFLRLLNSRGPRPLIQFILLMVALRAVAALSAAPGFGYDYLTYYSLVGRIDQFLIGMLAAYAFPRLRARIGRPWVAGLAVTSVLLIIWCFNQMHGTMRPRLWEVAWGDVEGVAWAAVLTSYVGTTRFGRGRLSAVLAWAGERSYGLYLLHVPVVYVVISRGLGLDLPGGFFVDAAATGVLVVLPGAMALAALSYASVERPFLSLRKRYVSFGVVPGAADLPAPRSQGEEAGARAGVAERRVGV
jgi:peptidoglycan/LPS O-acetylase OafA/YrhL